MSSHGTFATALNCMDGRAIPVVIDWMKRQYGVNYVDTISEPGMDNYLREVSGEREAWLRHKLEISIRNHGSRIVAIAGHDDCAGNPVSREEHQIHLRAGMRRLSEITRLITQEHIRVIGLWVFPRGEDTSWTVEQIAP